MGDEKSECGIEEKTFIDDSKQNGINNDSQNENIEKGTAEELKIYKEKAESDEEKESSHSNSMGVVLETNIAMKVIDKEEDDYNTQSEKDDIQTVNMDNLESSQSLPVNQDADGNDKSACESKNELSNRIVEDNDSVASDNSSLVEFQAFNKEDQTPITFLIDSKMLEKLLIRPQAKIIVTDFEFVPSGPVRNKSGDSAIHSQDE